MKTRHRHFRPVSLLLPGLAAAALTPALLPAQEEEAERCISLMQIDRTEVIDSRTIVFYMRGRTIYLNRLTNNCPNLDPNTAFSYRTSTGRLCSTDVITVVDDFGFGLRAGAACGLGRFEPVDEELIEMLKGEQEPAEVSVEEIEVEQ